jgi:cohesin loading factor subunit SCC2
LAVVIPDLPSTFRPEDYEVFPDSPDTPQHLSRKRKHSEIDGDDDDLSRSVDQREKADAAFRSLREYLQDIFEAEDQLQPDSIASNHFFTNTTDGTSLTIAAQTKVESLLQKIISVGRFSQAPLEDLLRLQKMCEPAVKDAESVDVKVDDSMGESEVQAWLQQTSVAELGIKAARTSLRLMTGGREDKQLYSEDVIQSALNAFKNVTETCIIPIVEMRSTGSSAALFKLLQVREENHH